MVYAHLADVIRIITISVTSVAPARDRLVQHGKKAGVGSEIHEVIYIAGMSHCGSTVLNLMLNAHPEIFAVGELIDLNRGAGENSHPPCPCGAPSLRDCEFWSRVNERTQQEQGLALSALDVLNDRKLDERSAPNAVVFRAISKVSGKKFIVDSSKRPGRLAYLMQLKGLDVFPIHLIREPNGQIWSLS